MVEIAAALVPWQMDLSGVSKRNYYLTMARERERWHAQWLRGLSVIRTLSATGWLTLPREDPRLLPLNRRGAPVLGPAEQTTLPAVVQATPQAAGLTWANWC